MEQRSTIKSGLDEVPSRIGVNKVSAELVTLHKVSDKVAPGTTSLRAPSKGAPSSMTSGIVVAVVEQRAIKSVIIRQIPASIGRIRPGHSKIYFNIDLPAVAI